MIYNQKSVFHLHLFLEMLRYLEFPQHWRCLCYVNKVTFEKALCKQRMGLVAKGTSPLIRWLELSGPPPQPPGGGRGRRLNWPSVVNDWINHAWCPHEKHKRTGEHRGLATSQYCSLACSIKHIPILYSPLLQRYKRLYNVHMLQITEKYSMGGTAPNF